MKIHTALIFRSLALWQTDRMSMSSAARAFALLFFAFSLAACGGGGGGGGAVPAPPTPSSTPGGAISPQSVTLKTVVSSSIESGIDTSYDSPDYFSASAGTAKGKLFVFLAGTSGVPRLYQDILREGAVRGYHVIGLTYVNGTEVHDYCASSTDPACWGDVRSEIVYGNGTTNLLTVTPADSIVGRLTALLTYLSTAYPSENWAQFLSTGAPAWAKIVVGGHSQGAGHAAYLAKGQSLAGVCAFDSPDDGSLTSGTASWLSQPNSTSVNVMYGFTNQDDQSAGFAGVTANWSLIGFPGQPTDVDGNQPPYGGSHQLYTVASSSITSDTHGYPVIDYATPVVNGIPAFTPVWDTVCFP